MKWGIVRRKIWSLYRQRGSMISLCFIIQIYPQYILDEKGDIIFINNCAIEIYGHTKKFYIGKNFLTLAAPRAADVSQIEAKIKKAFDGEPQSG